MKLGSWVLCLLLTSSVTGAADYESARRSSRDENGNEIGWYVTDGQFLKTPEWKFDGKNSPPLAMQVAYERAYSWLKRTFPKMTSFDLHSYELSKSGGSNTPNRWYYTFDFFGEIDGSTVHNPRFSVMVLMDGTIIEPRSAK